MRRMASDALFYLQYLKGISEAEIFTVIHYEADKLLHFDYHSFTPEFICRLESKFPNMVTESSWGHDFDKLVNSN